MRQHSPAVLFNQGRAPMPCAAPTHQQHWVLGNPALIHAVRRGIGDELGAALWGDAGFGARCSQGATEAAMAAQPKSAAVALRTTKGDVLTRCKIWESRHTALPVRV